jgi:hypothetical protein
VGFLLQRIPDGFSDRLSIALVQGYSASAPIQLRLYVQQEYAEARYHDQLPTGLRLKTA